MCGCTSIEGSGRHRHVFHLLRECSVAEFIGLFTLDWSSNCPSWNIFEICISSLRLLYNTLGSLKQEKFTVSNFLEAWSPKSRCQQGHAPSELWRGVPLPFLASGSYLWCSDSPLLCSDSNSVLPLTCDQWPSSSCDHLRLFFFFFFLRSLLIF